MRRRYIMLAAVALVGVVLLVLVRSHDDAPASPAASAAAPSRTAPTPAPRISHEAAASHGVFEGHVFDAATGGAIPNAQITFTSDASTAFTIETDATGAFTFEPPAAGRYLVASLTAPDHLPFAPDFGTAATSLVARAGVRITEIALYLTPDIELVASVVDADGAPVAGATVAVLDGSSTSAAVSDTDGRARLHALASAIVEAHHPTLGVGRARIGTAELAMRRVTIQLGPGAWASGRITGRVVDAAGAPVPLPLIRAMNVAVGELHPKRDTHGDGDGRFVLDGLDAGLHVVWVVCDRCIASRVRATTGDNITLVVGAGSPVRGRVVDAADGTPIPAFTVALARPRGFRDVVLEEHAIVDADGRFEFLGVPTGDYHVTATAASHAVAQVDVEIGDSPPAELVVRLGGSGAIRGHVIDRATGAGVASAAVSVDLDRAVDSSVAHGTVATTDESGAFVLDSVPLGPHSIRAIAEGHHMALVGGVRVAAGAIAGPIEVSLAPLADGEAPQLDTCGIGAVLNLPGVIMELVPDGGAQRAGLLVGDEIVAIDGRSTSGLTSQDALDAIRGPEGSYVVLSVRRDHGLAADFSVERRVFRRPRPQM